jgi:hypothetical protein
MIDLKNPLKMSKIRKMMIFFPIPLVMKIIILFDWRMEPFYGIFAHLAHEDMHSQNSLEGETTM